MAALREAIDRPIIVIGRGEQKSALTDVLKKLNDQLSVEYTHKGNPRRAHVVSLIYVSNIIATVLCLSIKRKYNRSSS